MLPVIALIGHPNVGKSTLFNYLTKSRNALVANEAGVTRDRQYGVGMYEAYSFIVIDTGGLTDSTEGITIHITHQTQTAIAEADLIFWVTDARAGLTIADQSILKLLRTLKKTVYVLVNKADGIEPSIACAEFYTTGFKQIFAISATQGLGFYSLFDAVFGANAQSCSKELSTNSPSNINSANSLTENTIKVAIVGRPNAGKSTLVNRILGEERVVVHQTAGTTRDSILIPFSRRNKQYVLIDTAGVRRRRSVSNFLEKFSVIKTLQAIAMAHVVVLVIDAHENLAEQDLHLIGHIIESGRALVIAVNKWDGLSTQQRQQVEKSLDRRLSFIRYARLHFISGLHGSGVGNLFTSIHEAYRSATQSLSTTRLTRLLASAVADHQPPAIQGRRIKLRYAHVGGNNPPLIIIHGNQTPALPANYQKYLINYFRDHLGLMGTPLRIELRSGENPYENKKNKLTQRQVKRRQRLIKHTKKV